jgi:hypothetical protein
MAAYLQMGHDSENLVGVPGLEGFSGLVLSPVNRSEGELSKHISAFRQKGNYDLVLDPQLYCPKSERGQLPEPSDALRIASIMSSRKPPLCYIVVDADLPPRREIENAPNLFSLMLLVSTLEKSGCPTLVSHCSSDMVLMKAAGASHCASGKFFNLRRFSRSRFDEEQDVGGGQLPYWFEQGLLAFLRGADIARLRRSGFDNFIGVGASNNIFASQILEQFVNEPTKAWLGLSWRQYLAWFELTEKGLSVAEAPTIVSNWLKEVEQRWEQLESKNVLLEESRNNGRWIRPWRQALGDFSRFGL